MVTRDQKKRIKSNGKNDPHPIKRISKRHIYKYLIICFTFNNCSILFQWYYVDYNELNKWTAYKFYRLLHSNINSLNSENPEKIRKKEDVKDGSEIKEKYIKKEEIKDDEGLDKKDRKYYKVTIPLYFSSCSIYLSLIFVFSFICKFYIFRTNIITVVV